MVTRSERNTSAEHNHDEALLRLRLVFDNNLKDSSKLQPTATQTAVLAVDMSGYVLRKIMKHTYYSLRKRVNLKVFTFSNDQL
jgi:hypothetical protein